MPQPRFAGPPAKGPTSAKAKGPVPDSDVPDVLASTEPDDDLDSFIVPPDPEPEDLLVEQPRPVAEQPAAVTEPVAPASPPTTADTELVARLEAELARARAKLAGSLEDPTAWPAPPPPSVQPRDGEKVLIHIRKDGFTACGRVWYKGQELEFTVGAENWKSTIDRDGVSWVLFDDSHQIRRYGDVMFGHGPWPGAPWDDERAAAAEARRGREAPSIVKLADRLENARPR